MTAHPPYQAAPRALRRWLGEGAALFWRQSALFTLLAYALLAGETIAPHYLRPWLDNIAWQTLLLAASVLDKTNRFNLMLLGVCVYFPRIALAVLVWNSPDVFLSVAEPAQAPARPETWSITPAYLPGLTESFLPAGASALRWAAGLAFFWQFFLPLVIYGTPFVLAGRGAAKGLALNWRPVLTLAALAWLSGFAVNLTGATYLGPLLVAYFGCVHWAVFREIYLGQTRNTVHAPEPAAAWRPAVDAA